LGPAFARRAIFQFGQAAPDHVGYFAAQGRHVGPQAGNHTCCLRLDQRALALPLLAFLCESLAEQITPSIK
jgi:hypothetical protein